MKKGLNLLLAISFLLTLLVPLTGVPVHKLAATVFLLLCIVHTVVYRRRLSGRRIAMLAVVFLVYASGLFGLIFDQAPLLLLAHRVLSLCCLLLLAVHVISFQLRLKDRGTRGGGRS